MLRRVGARRASAIGEKWLLRRPAENANQTPGEHCQYEQATHAAIIDVISGSDYSNPEFPSGFRNEGRRVGVGDKVDSIFHKALLTQAAWRSLFEVLCKAPLLCRERPCAHKVVSLCFPNGPKR
jgi:hypothetical protein